MSDKDKLIIDKEKESDGQMVLRISKKFVLLLAVLFFFDLLIDIASSLIDMVMGLLHIIIDFFEYSFEVLLEHVVNANHQESEVIVVNLAIILLIYGVYRFFLLLPRLYKVLIKKIKLACSTRQQLEADCWHHLSMNRKIKVCLTYFVWLSFIVFVLTL